MTRYTRMIDGDEYDALTGSRKFYRWRTGQVSKIKRRFRRRERRNLKRDIPEY